LAPTCADEEGMVVEEEFCAEEGDGLYFLWHPAGGTRRSGNPTGRRGCHRCGRYAAGMAGDLQALLLRSTARNLREAALPTVPLAAGSGLVLLPLTEEIVASVVAPAAGGALVEGFYELTTEVADWAARQSLHGEVAYLHTEFFGGGGFHAAVAWRDGEIAWGPMFTATSAGEAEDHYSVVEGDGNSAVDVMLRWLGVQRGDQADEFAAAGLDRRRWTEDWAAPEAR
jgi:hypothetical protein